MKNTEIKKRLLSGESFVMTNKTNCDFYNHINEMVVFKVFAKSRINHEDPDKWKWIGVNDGYNIDKITGKTLHVYTIDMFGDVRRKKIPLTRIVFLDEVENRKREHEAYQARIDDIINNVKNRNNGK